VAQLAGFEHLANGVIDAEELVVLADDLDQPGLVFREQREVLDQIEQAGAVAGAAQHHFERHAARFVLALDTLPLHPTAPVGGERADAAVGAVAGDEQRVAPEQRRNLLPVVGEVLVEGGPRRHAGFLEFDHHPRQSIDEADQVGPAGIEHTGHAELADQHEVVVLRVFPIDDAQAFGALATTLAAVFAVGYGHRDAFLEQPIDLAVGGFQTHRRAVAGQFVDGGLDRLRRQLAIKFAQRRFQTFHQHHLAPGLAPQRAVRAEGFFQRRHRPPTQAGE
jgi:hypothetical protein